jgi:hypothetical protein
MAYAILDTILKFSLRTIIRKVMVHKRRYLVLGYSGSKLFPMRQMRMAAGARERDEIVSIFKAQPEIRNIHIMKDGWVKAVEEEFALVNVPKAYRALWHDKPKVKEVVVEK